MLGILTNGKMEKKESSLEEVLRLGGWTRR
jgi:hypothetical protein